MTSRILEKEKKTCLEKNVAEFFFYLNEASSTSYIDNFLKFSLRSWWYCVVQCDYNYMVILSLICATIPPKCVMYPYLSRFTFGLTKCFEMLSKMCY